MDNLLQNEISRRAKILSVPSNDDFGKGLTELIERMSRDVKDYGQRFGLQLSMTASFQIEVSESVQSKKDAPKKRTRRK